MARELPYRSKPPSGLFNMMQEALSSTFFMVQETGPTSFVLKDQSDQLFKVRMGGTHSCSCGGGRSEHCLHTLYVILKIFKVLPSNPISWQLSFNDAEINWILKNRVNPAEARPERAKKNTQEKIDRIPLSEEYGCAICQEEMRPGPNLVFCKVSCGHNFHAKCMKVWADHKVANRECVTCPLCRNDWGRNALREIERISKRVAHKPGAECRGCDGRAIRGPRYHCLICEDTDLCSSCKNNHPHPLISKNSPNEPWVGENRGPLEFLQERDLNDADYELLVELDRKAPLAESILKAIESAGNGICCICNVQKPCKMKMIQCGHLAHEDCLLFCLRDERYKCPLDKVLFLPGLKLFNKVKEPTRKNSAKTIATEQLYVGGVAVAPRNNNPPPRRRPDVRVRRGISRPLQPIPELMVSGIQHQPARRIL